MAPAIMRLGRELKIYTKRAERAFSTHESKYCVAPLEKQVCLRDTLAFSPIDLESGHCKLQLSFFQYMFRAIFQAAELWKKLAN